MGDTFQTVGIDIGTSTTSLIIATLTIENTASGFSLPHLTISDKQITYRSPVIFTPLIDHIWIDEQRIRQFVAEQYQSAHANPDHFKIGAIIMTGETARKVNADKVLHALSTYAGRFVCATAGPGLESLIAAKSAARSLLTATNPQPVINIDIGGGTSNLAYFTGGRCQDTACFDIGGRLIRLDTSQHVTYIAPKLKPLINRVQPALQLGKRTTVAELMPVIQAMTHVLERAVGIDVPAPEFEHFITDNSLTPIPAPTTLTFSGGVADCLTTELPTDPFRYGDVGPLLGYAVRQSRLFTERHVHQADETIQATVVGAGSQTMMLSGSTISYTPDTLPLQNVPVITIEQLLSTRDTAKAITAKLTRYPNETVALALPNIVVTFAELQRWAQLILTGMAPAIAQHIPLVIIMQPNAAKALGNSLRSQLPPNYPLVCLDNLSATSDDYLDIGLPVADGQTVPVIVKTLIFN